MGALAEEIASDRGTQPTGGMVQDIQAISHFLHYSDALFVDKQCHRLLCDSQATDRLPTRHAQVFSISNREEFLRYLEHVEREAPAGHREQVLQVYGKSRLEPFVRLYEWRDEAAGP